MDSRIDKAPRREDRGKKNRDNNSAIDKAVNDSVKELQMLANFYKEHGKSENAQEISLTVRQIRRRKEEQSRS